MPDYRQADLDEARSLVPDAHPKAQERVARALAKRERSANTPEVAGAGAGMPCCPQCTAPNRDAGGYSMLRCAGCGHLWDRAAVEVTHG